MYWRLAAHVRSPNILILPSLSYQTVFTFPIKTLWPLKEVPSQIMDTVHETHGSGWCDVRKKIANMGFFPAQKRLAPVLEKMTVLAVSTVVPQSVTRQGTARDRGERNRSGSRSR
jgi:hypothetical protein